MGGKSIKDKIFCLFNRGGKGKGSGGGKKVIDILEDIDVGVPCVRRTTSGPSTKSSAASPKASLAWIVQTMSLRIGSSRSSGPIGV
jgi:hypothetical protein